MNIAFGGRARYHNLVTSNCIKTAYGFLSHRQWPFTDLFGSVSIRAE